MSEAWKTGRLGKYCYIKARIGWRGLSASEYTESGPYLIAGKHIENGIIDWNTCDHISEFRYRESWEIALSEGDVIISKDGTIGRVARVDSLPGNATINGTMMLIRPAAEIDYRFLYHVLNGHGFKKLIDDKVSGSSIPHIFQRDIVTLPIDLPPLAHQAQIAAVLDSVDSAIRETESIIAKLKAVKQGLLHDLLTRGIDANGELRPVQTEAPHLYAESPLGWIPKEWTTATIDGLTESSVIGPFGSDLVASDYRSSGVPVVFVRDVKPNRLSWISNVYVSPAKAQRLAAHEVRPGDVIATKMGLPPCVAAVYPPSMAIGIATADIVRLRPLLNRVRPTWMAYSLNSHAVARQAAQITAGVTRPKVTLRDVRNLEMTLPRIAEQDLILTRWDAVESRLLLEEAELAKLGDERSGLMDDLLTGRIHVTALVATADGHASVRGT